MSDVSIKMLLAAFVDSKGANPHTGGAYRDLRSPVWAGAAVIIRITPGGLLLWGRFYGSIYISPVWMQIRNYNVENGKCRISESF
ncbi:MAG: hypothetical protein JSU94_07325 [Phycisphaerales bacterium]|nr:MAG: hypothetical protein JSU94_07325 [Phycisphaerales bacterium]